MPSLEDEAPGVDDEKPRGECDAALAFRARAVEVGLVSVSLHVERTPLPASVRYPTVLRKASVSTYARDFTSARASTGADHDFTRAHCPSAAASA